MPNETVIIIGAGLAGLNCARELRRAGIPFALFEQSDRVGGRIKTDRVDGYKLDHGFQVLLAAYPEAQAALDYPRLQLQPFYPGSLVQYRGHRHLVADPLRRPADAVASLFGPIGTLKDKLLVAKLWRASTRLPLETHFNQPSEPTLEMLRNLGFSNSLLERFLKPFLAGVHLDPDLETSSVMTQFVFRMFAAGPTTLPLQGMAALPEQLAQDLPADQLHLSTPVQAVNGNSITLQDGTEKSAEFVVLATDLPGFENLSQTDTKRPHRRTTTWYFAAERSPISRPCLLLNGDGLGPINHLCVPSDVAANYAPQGRTLISVSEKTTTQEISESSLRQQLESWFGPEVQTWETLKRFPIRHALPSMRTIPQSQSQGFLQITPHVLACGDHCTTSSIQGALRSGRKAAQNLIQKLK